MNHSTGKPTKYEAERIEAMLRLGCCCCAQLDLWHIAECQHIVESNRLGHWYTLPWCPGHHRSVWDEYQLEIIPKDLRVALSDGSKPFEKIYGTQRQQWEKVQKRLGLTSVWPSSKILPRRLGRRHVEVDMGVVEGAPGEARPGDASPGVRDVEASGQAITGAAS